MNAEAKQKWVKALRSGQYVKVKGVLYGGRNGVVRCCAMGVLNDISGLGKWVDNMYVVDELEGEVLEEYLSVDLWTESVFALQNALPELKKFIHTSPYPDDVYVRAPTPEEVRELSDQARKLYEECLLGEEEFAHTAVQGWAGLKTKNPTVIWDGQPFRIHELNDDDAQIPFTTIADLIEEQL